MSSLTTEEQGVLESIFKDLQLLFGKDEILPEEVDDLIDQLESEEAKSYLRSLKEAKPETALSDAFFAGRSVLKKYMFGDAIPEAVVGEGFIDYKVRAPGEKVIWIELKPLFEPKTRRVKTGRELRSLKQKRLKYEEHKEQILKYIREGGEYIILTNLKDLVFFSKSVTAAEFEPFTSTGLMEFHKEFEVERNLWDYLTRLDQQSIREDLDKRFFESLNMWVNKLSEVEFTVDEKRKTELIINLINKFIFIQTLDDYRVIEHRWIQQTWGHNERRWGSKGKGQVLKEFFRELDNWFYQYYDTELFRDEVLNYVKQERQNLDLFHKNLRLVLGLEYWMSALGGFRGIIQYNFRYIDEDILGKAYETYLAGVRHEEGIYYTPKFITQYIVENTVGDRLDKIVKKLSENIEKEDFEEVKVQLNEFTSIRVLDPACGSGSFLIKAVRKIWEKYKDIEALLREAERKHNKWQGSFERQKETAEKVEKFLQVMDILGPRNDRGLISRILVRHIHGNDKDKKALDVAKLNIWLEAIKLSPAEFRYDKLPEDTNYILPDLEMNLCNGDSVVGLPENRTVDYLIQKHKEDISKLCELRNEYLADPSNPELIEQIIEIKTRLREDVNEEFKNYLHKVGLPVAVLDETIPFHWALGFWYFYFDDKGEPLSAESRGVHVVIGNPPYERIEILNKKAPIYVKYLNNAGFKAAVKQYDLAAIFIEKGFNLLKETGTFGYIVTNKFMRTKYGQGIRSYLSEKFAVKEIVDFGDQQVFEEATTYTILLFLSKENNHRLKFSSVTRLNKTYDQLLKIRNTEFLEEDSLMTFYCEAETLTAAEWRFSSPAERKLEERLRDLPRLGKIADNIFEGLHTSADKVYTIKIIEDQGTLVRAYSRSKKKEYILEKDLLKPLLMGKDIRRWVSDTTDLLVIFPYKIKDGKAFLIDEKAFKAQYPRTWKYLSGNKAELEKRDRGAWKGRSDWYAYGRRQNLEQFDQPKIIMKVLADKPCFALDFDGEFYFVGGGNAGGYGIVFEGASTEDLEYFCALLNSSFSDWQIRKIGSRFRGGFYSYGKRFSEKLIMRIPQKGERLKLSIRDKIKSLVEEIVAHKCAEREYLRLWNYWSVKLKGNEYVLGKILESDFEKMRDGAFEETWTRDVTFYPNQERGVLTREYSGFRVVGEQEQGIIRIFGLDESNREELTYLMKLGDRKLTAHIYASIMSLLESRKRVKTLSDIFSKTKVSVITPSPLQQTPNIIKKVGEEFSKWKQRSGLTDIQIESLDEIHKNVENMEAKIDSFVFILYSLDKSEVTTVLDSLSLPVSYQEKVLSHFDKGERPVN